MWELSGLPRTNSDIFLEFAPHTLRLGQPFPESVEAIVAIHRDGVSRMRAVYDHRIRHSKEGPVKGLDHFARHLPEYCAASRSIAHHSRPQSSWLGSDLEIYTDILPMEHLERLRDIVGGIIGTVPPPLPIIHQTSNKSLVSDEARKWFELWTAHDTGVGWDGKTTRIFGTESQNET